MGVPDKEVLASLLCAVEAQVEAEGWNRGPLLIAVAATSEPNAIVMSLPPDPIGYIESLSLGPSGLCVAVGVCAEGWMAEFEPDSDIRPSQRPGRMRTRTACIVAADGTVVSGLRVAGEEFGIVNSEPLGAMVDALRAALGVGGRN